MPLWPSTTHPADTFVTIFAESTIAEGWMPGGWGGYRFRFTNPTATPARLARWHAHWEARGQATGQPWSATLDQPIPAHGSAIKDEIGFLPAEIVQQARPDHPVMVGQFRVQHGGREYDLPFRLVIPGATLPEPLKLVQGRYVGLALMESRFATFSGHQRSLDWLDRAYAAMHDLTGRRPDNGKLLVLQEAPANPYYAYAGNPIVLNTRHVGGTLHEINERQMPFGWLHEIGHTFDVLGAWYNWNTAAAEFQANWKLAYAFEQLDDGAWTIDWRKFHNPSYGHSAGNTFMRGRQFVDALFTFNGDRYLDDHGRGWESLTSDEWHSMFQRLQRVYGWEPFRRWYRVYGRLHENGYAPPPTAIEKINLCAAILERVIGADLHPIWQRWRLPITQQTSATIARTYDLDRLT